MAKITELTVSNFRGIAESITVSFAAANNRPTSIILFGDNGSGKSSFVDALEFALRGRLSRRSPEGRKIKREVRNLARNGAPGVIVKLDDSKSIRRGGGLPHLGIREFSPQEIVDGFQYSPIIIRRQDIESFWWVAESERQAFFFDYLGNYQSYSQRQAIDRLKVQLEESEAELARKADRLADLTNIPARDLPNSYNKTNSFLTRRLLPRYGVDDRAAKRKRLPRRMWAAYLAFQGAIKHKENVARQISQLPDPGPLIDRELTRILQSLTNRVTVDFITVSQLTWVEKVEILADAESRLSISIRLGNGRSVDPTQVLSEAYLDLLALLILVEVHIECSTLGQSTVIALDDVFQSVDTVNRIRALDHILSRLKGWQVIITLHDRLWLELTKRAMHRANHAHIVKEVVPANFGSTPRLRNAIGRSVDELRRSIANHDSPEAISACTGRTLEELCESLSISLATKIARRPGDRYTLGDLWPGISSSLEKHGPESAKSAAADVSRFISLRNIAGAHYNEYAASLSSKEAIEFGKSALALWDACKCPTCGSSYSKVTSPDGRSSDYMFPCNHKELPSEQ